MYSNDEDQTLPVALATKHGKQKQLYRPFHTIGLDIVGTEGLDTDLLGTFTGEIEREGSPLQVAIKKARMAISHTGIERGLASEGSFGPHPASPFLASDYEVMAFVDGGLGIVITESILSLDTNYGSTCVTETSQLESFLEVVKFPSHGVVVRPSSHWDELVSEKGITEINQLDCALKKASSSSADGLAMVSTDMRAHMNPSRQKVIRRLGFKLARRIMHKCFQCSAFGFGVVDVVRGLPCEACGAPSDLVRDEILGCALCDYKETRPRKDRTHASPAQCSWCNP